MQRHNLAQHMQEFTQMHMWYMAEFLRGLSLNGTTSKSLRAHGPAASCDDQEAAATERNSSGARRPVGGNGSSNCAPSQPSEGMQQLREMDARLVKQDHQIRELTIYKETQVGVILMTRCKNRPITSLMLINFYNYPFSMWIICLAVLSK